jgi:hypothetical protein
VTAVHIAMPGKRREATKIVSVATCVLSQAYAYIISYSYLRKHNDSNG